MFLKIRRFLAVYIDFILIFYLCYFFANLINVFDNIFYQIFDGIVVLILFLNIFLRKDCIIGCESIGKKIMHLKIYKNSIRVENKKILIDRVLCSMGSFCFYPFMIFINNKSSGDNKYGTEVK